MRIGLLLIFFVAGCQAISPREQAVAKEKPLTKADIRKARRIVVECSDSFLDRTNSTRWVFEADGRCFGELPSKITVELPPEIFREAQEVLLKSEFLSLKRDQMDGFFESSSRICVECEGHKHAISFATSTQRCQPLFVFLHSLSNRGKVTSSPDNRP